MLSIVPFGMFWYAAGIFISIITVIFSPLILACCYITCGDTVIAHKKTEIIIDKIFSFVFESPADFLDIYLEETNHNEYERE